MKTKQQTLKEIQSILNQADSSRMELKFGCEVVKQGNPIWTFLRVDFESDEHYLCWEESRDLLQTVNKYDLKKILGQKPDLQGVLNHLREKEIYTQYRISSDGEISSADSCGEEGCCGNPRYKHISFYNLSLPFDQQELSTLTAILELLKK